MPRKNFTDEQVQQFRKEYAADESLTVVEMSEVYEVPITTMRNLICGRSYPEVAGAVLIRNPQGGTGNRRCPEEIMREINRMLSAGCTTNHIAEVTGASTSHVHYIRNQTYAYLQS